MPETLRGGIIISEILARPQSLSGGLDVNNNGSVEALDEFVELYNSGNADIDIGGLQLWAQYDPNWYTVPAGTILKAGHSAIIMPDFDGGTGPTLSRPDDIALDAGYEFDVILNDSDTIVLLDPTADEYLQVDFGGGSPDSPNTWTGFPSTATRLGAADDWGTPVDGESIQRDPQNLDSTFTAFPDPGSTPICFASGTMIRTDRGDIPVEQLKPGDMVITLEGGAEKVHWVGGRRLGPQELMTKFNLWPIRIEAGALGPGLPERDLIVSPQHRLLLANPVVERMIGARQAMVAAKHLQGLAGVNSFYPSGGITYLHVMLREHRTLFAENAPAESLFLGPQARKSLPPGALEELSEIFPELLRGETQMAPARAFMKGKQAKKLTERLVKNKKSALADQI